jgi:hypothetical protein
MEISNLKQIREDDRHDMFPFHEDIKLMGPLIDLLDPNNTLSQFTSVNVPNAKYEEVEFNFKNLLLLVK